MKDTSAKQKSAAGKDEQDNLDDEELDTADWECINTHVTKIYEHNLTNYIIITLEACQEWARDLVSLYFTLNSCFKHVTPKYPPQSLPYITLKGAKQAKINELVPDQSPGWRGANTITLAQFKMFSQLLENHKNKTSSPIKRANTPLSSPPNETHLQGYIEFLGIRNKEDTLSKLIANRFNSHKVFKFPGLLCSELRELGLTRGVVTVLFDNVGTYDKYLTSQNHWLHYCKMAPI
ncbi:hypothetical protein VP01_1488g5 [Puccinia sorghi]|uniref:Uncharacterized protein n=1 Tax=Puccinia sorghi TaxID=27349 RepID=A0A0L6VJG5_9BASI|nr:hypothetical protein VP01_1488g5 [Puccinia sorghi]